MYDDTIDLTTQLYHISYLPLPVLLPSIPCPTSHRCDTTGVSVPPPRRSVPVISRVPYTSVTCLLCVSNDRQNNPRKSTPSPSSLSYSFSHEIYVCMTGELTLPTPHPPRRPYPTRSHIHTGPLVIATSPSLWLNPP